MSNPYAANIRKLYLIQTLTGFLFTVPIFYTILNSYGLSASDLFLLQAGFAIAVVCFEIPTGFLGDKYGRKNSILIGAILSILGYFSYYQATGFWGFLGGEIIIALAASCISGCDKALLYDSLLQIEKEQDYKKVSGIFSSLSNFAESIGAIIAGMVVSYGLKTPFLLDATASFLALLVILSLKEVTIERFDHKEANRKQIKEVYAYIIHGHQFLGRLLLLGAILSGVSLSLVWITQPYMKKIGISLFHVGLVRSGLNLSVGLFHLIGHKYESRLGAKNTFISLITLRSVFIGIAGFLMNTRGLLCFLVFAFTRAIQRTVTEDVMQTAVISKMRATIASVQSMLFRFSFVVLGPLLGWMHDVFGLQYALRIFAVVSGILSFGLLIKFWNNFRHGQTTL